jgi:hypothetical protein
MSSGGTQTLEALAGLSGILNFTPRRVAFVPAKFPDKTPIPEGFDVVHLNPPVQVRACERQTFLYSPAAVIPWFSPASLAASLAGLPDQSWFTVLSIHIISLCTCSMLRTRLLGTGKPGVLITTFLRSCCGRSPGSSVDVPSKLQMMQRIH